MIFIWGVVLFVVWYGDRFRIKGYFRIWVRNRVSVIFKITIMFKV